MESATKNMDPSPEEPRDSTASTNHDDDNQSIGAGSQASYYEPTPEDQEEIAKSETKCVYMIRGVTFGFLLLATIGVALAVYLYVDTTEQNAFDETFHDNAVKVLEAVGTLFDNTLLAVDLFTAATTSYAAALYKLQNPTDTSRKGAWPFVTIPDYAVRGSKLNSLSKTFLFSQYYYVEHAERDAWENYTRNNDAWVDEGIEVQETDPSFRGAIVEEWSTLGEINFNGQRMPDAEFYLVRWQSAPIVVRGLLIA